MPASDGGLSTRSAQHHAVPWVTAPKGPTLPLGVGLLAAGTAASFSKLPERCQHEHGVEEGIMENKTKPTPELARGHPVGINPPAPTRSRSSLRGHVQCAVTPAIALLFFKKGGKSSFNVKSTDKY